MSDVCNVSGMSDELLGALHALRRQAAFPSSRAIAERTSPKVSHTTVSNLFNGAHVPLWPQVATVVAALGGDPADFEAMWQVAYRRHREATWHIGPRWEYTQVDTTVTDIATMANQHATDGWEPVHVITPACGGADPSPTVSVLLRRFRPQGPHATAPGQ